MRAIVYKGLVAEDKSVFKHLQEYPLRPLIVILVCRVYDTGPVKGKTYGLKLLREVLDVCISNYPRMGIRFYGVIFSRKTEGVKAYREKDIVALHTALSRDDLKA